MDRGAAQYRDAAGDAAEAKLKGLAEPAFRQIYLGYDEAADWDPADPRLEELADLILAFAARYDPGPDTSSAADMAGPVTVA